MLCDNLEGWDGVRGGREIQEGVDKGMLMADSCCSMAEANTVKQLSSVKKKKIMRETCKNPIGIFLL